MFGEAVDSTNIEECRSSLCDTKPCHNEGLCLDHDNGTFSCDCQGVFGGPRCEEEGSLCDQSPPPCENGGTCSGNSSHYHCYCPWGHTGKHCDTGTSHPDLIPLTEILPSSRESGEQCRVPGRESPGAGREDLPAELQGREAGADLQHSGGDRTVGVERSEGG